MQAIGKKGKQWIKDRKKIIAESLLSGRIVIRDGQIEGRCEDCKKWKVLDPDHRTKRSQGGSNDISNIDWVCRECHNKRDNMGDPGKKKKDKHNWKVKHLCIQCKKWTRFILCENCGRISLRTK
jgi:hypothetical protein